MKDGDCGTAKLGPQFFKIINSDLVLYLFQRNGVHAATNSVQPNVMANHVAVRQEPVIRAAGVVTMALPVIQVSGGGGGINMALPLIQVSRGMGFLWYYL